MIYELNFTELLVLTVLETEPMRGLDIVATAPRHLKIGSIHIQLNRMIIRELVLHEERTEDHPSRYRITDTGREALKRYNEYKEQVDATKAHAAAVAWAVEQWEAQVQHRPLNNKNRRALDDVWRQVITHFGGDPVALLGPAHDDRLVNEKDVPVHKISDIEVAILERLRTGYATLPTLRELIHDHRTLTNAQHEALIQANLNDMLDKHWISIDDQQEYNITGVGLNLIDYFRSKHNDRREAQVDCPAADVLGCRYQGDHNTGRR